AFAFTATKSRQPRQLPVGLVKANENPCLQPLLPASLKVVLGSNYGSLRKRSKLFGAKFPDHAVRFTSRHAARRAVLRNQGFRRFYAGYATSLLGSAMSSVALTFAVLSEGASAADLGYVFAAGVIPQVMFMLGGGVLADRIGRRKVMLAADSGRLGA